MATHKKGLNGFLTMIIPVLSLLLSITFPLATIAQDYPKQPITMICGSGPGGPTDVATRALAGEAKQFLNNQDVFVINKVGAGHMVAMSAVMSARSDGYTLGSSTDGAYIRGPHILTLKFDPLTETVPIIAYSAFYCVVVVRTDSPFKTFQDIVDYAKANPNKLSLGHFGYSSSPFLNVGSYALQLGIIVNHVPYPSDAEAVLALLGGHIMVAGVGSSASLTPQIKAGNVRVLAICEGDKRIPSLPAVPTLYELGFKDAAPPLLNIIFGQKDLPKPIVKKLEDALGKACETPNFKKMCHEQDYYLVDEKYKLGQDLRDLLTRVYKKNGMLIQKLGLTKSPAK